MKYILFLLCTLFCGTMSAQTPAETNVSRNRYPAILPDNRVEFHVKAPNALKVQIDLGKLYDMTKDENGTWSVVTEPQGAGIHYYNLVVDGLSVADPASESFYGCSKITSCIEIPYAKGDDSYEVKNVPHGDVRTKYYFSSTTNSWRKMYIYTPAGYDQNLTKKYPVLYIMHGGGEDARGWVQQGRMDIVLDNQIASGKSVPMIAVSFDANVGGYSGIDKEIMQNVVPFVEANYRTSKESSKRALAGLSMGGIFTLYVGIPHNSFFNYLGVFSSGWFTQKNSFFGNGDEAEDSYKYLSANKASFNKNMKLFWISIGGEEDIAFNNCQAMRTRLDGIGIKYEFYDSKKGGHTWPVWRDDLSLFAPKLFK